LALARRGISAGDREPAAAAALAQVQPPATAHTIELSHGIE
jgi:hypothetical protein